MSLNYFRPKPGRFDVLPIVINQRLNTGTLAAGTQTHNLGGLPRRAIISGVAIAAETYPDATTVTLQVQKRDVSAGADVNLTAATNVDAQTAQTALTPALLTTLTDAQLLLDAGDTLKVSLVTTGTVTTQPDDLTVTVELLLLN